MSIGLRSATVSLSGRRCGVLSEEADGGTRFTYDVAWLVQMDARPVSLTMPLRAEAYRWKSLLPFFANLLPEGWLLDVSPVSYTHLDVYKRQVLRTGASPELTPARRVELR